MYLRLRCATVLSDTAVALTLEAEDGPYTSNWPERVVGTMLKALNEPLPAGETRDRLAEEIYRIRADHWEERQRSDEATSS